jgi:uncharacterized protein YndB with AHSA1/START domain
LGSIPDSHARAVADLSERSVSGSVELAASPERVFQALASSQIAEWWVRPGVFTTTSWTGDAKVGGRWRVTGVGNGRPFVLEGEFLEIVPPRKLVYTWGAPGARGAPTTVTFLLEPIEGGTRLTLQHSGFATHDWCLNTCAGWETSFERLAEFLAAEDAPRSG